MKINHLLAGIVCLVAVGTKANASTLYGSTSAGAAGELWIINPTNGAAIQDVGPLNDAGSANYAVTGLAFHPLTGVLYGSTGNKSGQKLLTINPATAAVTVVGPFGAGVGNTMADIAFDSAGNLYGIGASGGANLYTINITTGQATLVGPSGVSFTAGGGLAISPAGVFYGTPITTDFGTFDPTTGAYSNIINPAKPAGAGASYASLAFDGNTLYGMNLGTPTHLVTIDPSGNVTDLGASVNNIDGIAFQPAVAPVRPTLSIQKTTNGVLLSWPASASGFRLQQNTNLTTTNWVANTNPTNVVSGTNQVTVSPAIGNKFFRLINP